MRQHPNNAENYACNVSILLKGFLGLFSTVRIKIFPLQNALVVFSFAGKCDSDWLGHDKERAELITRFFEMFVNGKGQWKSHYLGG